MKILLLDIETAPNAAYVWGLWQQNVGTNMLTEEGYVLCWAAKWLNSDEMMYAGINDNGPKKMLQKAHSLLNQADAVIHYNGTKFDIPTLNKEFLKYEIAPPSPYKQIDLLKVARKQFRFPSNKLDYIAQKLGLGQKVRHKGFELWIECMQGNKDSWAQMEEYNKQDVALLEKLYHKLLAWIPRHPNHSVYVAPGESRVICTNCGSENLHKRGFCYTNSLKYQRFQCQACGSWSRGSQSILEKGEKVLHVS